MIRGVLLDLDDTLFDHRNSARQALVGLREMYPALAAIGLPELEVRHSALLEALHLRVLRGELDLDTARQHRFRQLFESAGAAPDAAWVRAAAAGYRDRYMTSWREVPGASAVLRALRGRARVGVVSNNLAREQYDKLRLLGFDRLLDAIVISEEAGVTKPDPAIFEIALRRLGTRPEETVMLGDSWSADVAGARAAGIRAVWFNPDRGACPEPSADVLELHSLEPISAVLTAILDDARPR